jgi:phage-related protein
VKPEKLIPKKPIRWQGSSLDDLKEFPEVARHEAGVQLNRVQAGLDPDDWKPFSEVGPGTREIRIRDGNGAFRVMYVAKFEDAIYVLHCFQKKSQQTTLRDKSLATARYRKMMEERKGTE